MDHTKPMKREDVLRSDYHQRGIQFCSPQAGRVALSFSDPQRKNFWACSISCLG